MAGNKSYRAHFKTSSKSAKGNRKYRTQGNDKHHGCGICKADHRIVTCKKFINLNLEQKHKTVRQLHYCSNCLARNHLLDKCTSKERCRICGQKHHTVLHGHKRILRSLPSSRPINNPQSATTEATHAVALPSSLHKVLVPTAKVNAMTDDGCIPVRAILNPSSTTSRIANSFVEKYKLLKVQLNDRKYVQLTITPNASSLNKYEIYFMVVRELPKTLYPTPIRESISRKFENLTLADPEFYANTPVEMELGGDIYSKFLKSNILRNDGSTLIAQDSTLGWLILGSYNE